MVRKFLNRTAEPESTRPRENTNLKDYYEGDYCFVYGTLMDPETLSRILKKSEPIPVMRRAKVIGYHVKLWGSYPALVDGKTGEEVYGMAFETSSETQLDPLILYETDKYQLYPCRIEIIDGDSSVTVEGVAFMWNGEEDELQEGNFDLKQWKKEKRLEELDLLSE